MNNNVWFHAAALLFGVFISCASQVLLKKSSAIQYSSWIREYLNVRVITAYAVFFLATLLSIYAYRVLPLTTGSMLEATGYIYVTVFDKIFFHQKITKRRIISLILIISGVFVFSYFG